MRTEKFEDHTITIKDENTGEEVVITSPFTVKSILHHLENQWPHTITRTWVKEED